jgi:hypothetical protein
MRHAQEPSYSGTTMMQIGIAAMLLVAVLYVGLGFAPDLGPTE